MDERLVAWARAVKRRRRASLPVLWLFTDAERLADPLPVIARLPRGLCGVVFRHDGRPKRAALGATVAALCRRRRIALVVAGDARLAAALHTGIHLREGNWPGGPRPGGPRPGGPRPAGLRTASAHDAAGLRRAGRCADIVFLSPAFPTASHPGAPAWGPARWVLLAARAPGVAVYALGGVHGGNVRRLGPDCAGAGVISALLPENKPN